MSLQTRLVVGDDQSEREIASRLRQRLPRRRIVGSGGVGNDEIVERFAHCDDAHQPGA